MDNSKHMKIYSIGIGPGDKSLITPQAVSALTDSEVIVAYTPYVDYISNIVEGKEVINTGMKKERERAAQAFAEAEKGKTVSVISSGDSGVYGMAPLLWEMKQELGSDIEIEVIPGISAMFDAAAKLGAPLGHDFCSISLSDLLTPWERIERRIEAAAQADFVTAIYNPVSKGRFWQLMRLKEIFLQYRDPATPVGIARQTGRPEQEIKVVALSDLKSEMADMFTLLIIGNSQTRNYQNKMITPRGYYQSGEPTQDSPGRQIMNESFRTILKEVDFSGKSLEHQWVAMHCIHTTADFSINKLLDVSEGAVPLLHQTIYSGKPPVIVTDVSMVTRGIRRAIIEKLGLEVKCYLDDPRVGEIAEKKNLTRSQVGIQLAVEEHPDAIFAFGNAPTALIELVAHIRKGKAKPTGVIAAPVGFVNVEESKWQLKYGCPDIPQIIISGRKGGSNVAATIINAILSWNEAKQLHPGEGL
jgi:precorrin-3B C17-methyltransferase